MLNKAAAPPAKGSRRTATPQPARPARRGRPPLWRNRFWLLALGGVVVVVAAIVAIGLLSRGSSSSTGGSTSGTQSSNVADRALLDSVANVEAQVSATVGNAGLPSTFVPLSGATPLAGADGKPEILYVGADYCPYCAAQRWSLVVALSRFGSFDHLGLTSSSSRDTYPDTATFSFHGSTYTSQYLDFAGVETSDREGRPLDSLTAAQKALFDKYVAPPYVPANATGGIPWLDVAGRYGMVSSGFTPQVLAGLSWSQIAAKLGDAKDPVTQGIVGNANNITAAICKATGMQPAAVCGAAPIAGLAAQLP